MDRVQVVKQEWASLGGNVADEAPFDCPIEPQEDAVEAAGLYLQDGSNRDESCLVSRVGPDMTFKDGNNPSSKTLTQLLESAEGGITATQHKALKHLIHFLGEGPGVGWASGSFKETLPPADPFPTQEIWWTSSGKTHKIVSLDTTRNANKTPATEVWKIYDADGSTVLVTLTDTMAYSTIFETTRTRTWA